MGQMVRRRLLVSLIWLGVVAALLPACGDGAKTKSIKVVIAEYSRDYTRPFWMGSPSSTPSRPA